MAFVCVSSHSKMLGSAENTIATIFEECKLKAGHVGTHLLYHYLRVCLRQVCCVVLTRLKWSSDSCLCFLNAEVKGLLHQVWFGTHL